MGVKTMSKINTEELKVQSVSEDMLPEIIHSQFVELEKLKISVEEAMSKAGNALESAKSAKDKSAGFFKKKQAIETLQDATYDLAKAQVSSTEAQKISFEYQEKLGKITKYLFNLGATNIAATRTVLRELEMRLRNASEEELDDLAREEVLSVVQQLKAQEDVMQKQQALSDNVKQHENVINNQDKKDKEHDRLIAAQDKKDKEHDRLIAEQVKKNKELQKLIQGQEKRDNELATLIKEQEKRDNELAKLIAEQEHKDNELAKLIEGQEYKDNELAKLIEDQEHKDNELAKLIKEQEVQDNKLSDMIKQQNTVIVDLKNEMEQLKFELAKKTGKVQYYIAIGIAMIALVLAVAQIFV
jgi:chromosome segregation ATPase